MDPLRVGTADLHLCRCARADHEQVRAVPHDAGVPLVRGVVELIARVGASLRVERRGHDFRESIGMRNRQRPQQHRVDHPKRCGRRANCDAEREDGGEADGGVLPELTPAEGHVKDERVEPRQAALIADGLHRLRQRARAKTSSPRRLVWRRAALPRRFGFHLEVHPQLVREVVVGAGARHGAKQAAAPLTKSAHGDHPGGQASPRSSACMIDDMRSHACRSAARSRRPAAVSA